MKKSPFVFSMLIMFMFVIAGGTAESRAEPGFKIGFQTIDGFRAGVFYSIPLGKNFAIQPEVNYTQRKYRSKALVMLDWFWTLSSFIPLPSDKVYETARYIEVPVLLKFYSFKAKGNFRPLIYIGGYSAFRISAKKKEDREIWYGNKRDYADVDAGLIAGAGFEHEVGNIKVHYDLRYTYGLTDILEIQRYTMGCVPEGDSELYLNDPEFQKNRTFSFSVGLSF